MCKRMVAVIVTVSCPHVDSQVLTSGRVFKDVKSYWSYDAEAALTAMQLSDNWDSMYAHVNVTIVRNDKTYTMTTTNNAYLTTRISDLFDVAWGIRKDNGYLQDYN